MYVVEDILSAAVVVSTQYTATATCPVIKGQWNFLGMILQQTGNTGTAHVTAITNYSKKRTALGTGTSLRNGSNTIVIGNTFTLTGYTASKYEIAAAGIELINGLTETKALAKIDAIQLIVRMRADVAYAPYDTFFSSAQDIFLGQACL